MSIEHDIRQCEYASADPANASWMAFINKAILARVAAAARGSLRTDPEGSSDAEDVHHAHEVSQAHKVEIDELRRRVELQWEHLRNRDDTIMRLLEQNCELRNHPPVAVDPEPLHREQVNRLRVAARALVDVRLGYAPQAADVTVPRRLIDDLRAALDGGAP